MISIHLYQFLITSLYNNRRDISIHAKGFKYFFKRSSFPAVEDEGIADLDVYGKNSQIKITWKITTRGATDTTPGSVLFEMADVHCSIDHLSLSIREARHK